MLNFNYATWSFFPEHNFRWWAKLTSIFLVLLFHIKQQAWFRVCVISVVSITFRSILPFAWCRRWAIISSWNLSINVSWSSSTFWALQGYRSNSCWEIPSLPLDELCYHRQHYCLPSKRKLVLVLCRTLSSLLSNLCYVLPWSITIFYVKNVMRITPPLKNSWYSDTSHHHHSFLVPVLILTGVPTSERCCLDSVLLATLMLWS